VVKDATAYDGALALVQHEGDGDGGSKASVDHGDDGKRKLGGYDALHVRDAPRMIVRCWCLRACSHIQGVQTPRQKAFSSCDELVRALQY